MANPQIPQGTLNRLIASVVWNDFPALNVTPSFLGKAGISIAFDGVATTFIPTMTGAVTSGEPYQLTTITINLLKTQGLAQQYESQRQSLSTIGSCVVRPDTTTLAPYDVINCGIENVRELAFSGEDAAYAVTIRGYTLMNSNLWG